MANLKLYLDCRRLKSDGSALLKISVSHLRSVRYVSLGISILPEMWDAVSCQVCAKYPGHQRLNLAISRIKLRADEAFLSVVLSGAAYTLDDIHQAVARAVSMNNEVAPAKAPRSLLVPVFERFLSTKIKIKTAELYATTLGHIVSFCGDASALRFEDVTRSWLLDFDAYLARSAKSPNARAVYMRNLRAVFNFAIDEGITTSYPFRKFRIKTVRTAKRSLSVEDLRRLFTMDVEPWQEQYRDFFKLTFLLIGINAVDLLGATHRSVVGGRLEFNRSKTQRLYSIKIEPEAQALLDEYRGDKHLLRCMDVCGNYENYLHRANNAMKSVGEVTRSGRGGKKSIKAEFPGISTYWMRHSWATIAASLDIPKETIAAALGHGGNTVTDIYIDFDQRKVDEANRRVLDWVLYGKRGITH